MSDPLPDVQSQTWTLPADLEGAVKAEIRVHLGKDVAAGLETLRRSVEQALV